MDIYAAGETDALSRMLDYRTFGYRRIKVLRPLRMILELDKAGMKSADHHQDEYAEQIKALIGFKSDLGLFVVPTPISPN